MFRCPFPGWAGIEPANALHLLKNVAEPLSEDRASFATIDLVSLDLMHAEASLYKFGSAPTYLKRGKTVKRIRSQNLAPGLRAEEADKGVTFRFPADSLLVVVSDGVLAGEDDNWLLEMLLPLSTDMKQLSRDILAEAARHNGQSDDATVICLRISERK